MKICLACTPDGHLGLMLRLMQAFDGHKIFFLTLHNNVSSALPYPKYLLKNPVKRPILPLVWAAFWGIISTPAVLYILLKERPQVLVSTGDGQVTIPAFYLAKLLGIKTIFVELWARVTTPSITGKLTYPVADVFLVQWQEQLKNYGKKAKYEGAII
jgi:beta-1,4-N-acetylglucosaminyltransferase